VARLQRRRFEDSDDVRITPRGRAELVELDDRVIARTIWQPGWRWSTDLKPIAGTQSCQFHHLGFAISGRVRIQTTDGVELEVGPGDVYEIPPGHDAWVVGDEPFISVDFEAMRGFARPQEAGARRSLVSILMTDIVESTAKAIELGSARWQDILSRHNEIAERTIDRHEGRLIKTTGDGVIGLFDSAERAVRAAVAIAQGVTQLGISIRAAVHTGEAELTAGDIRGVAVHQAARMMSLGGPDDVIVSSTVRDLVDGTDLLLEDFGMHELKGFTSPRQLYRIAR
jgi:class 3 adenylate cyclase